MNNMIKLFSVDVHMIIFELKLLTLIRQHQSPVLQMPIEKQSRQCYNEPLLGYNYSISFYQSNDIKKLSCVKLKQSSYMRIRRLVIEVVCVRLCQQYFINLNER